MDNEEPLCYPLRKLAAAAPPEDSLGQVLETLWNTRKTGLAPHQRPTVQSLLNLPSVQDLDPVLAWLRSIIRKTLNENLNEDNIRMLFPLDVSDELQSSLVLLLNKYQNQWKEETSRDQPLFQQIRVSKQDNVTDPPALTRAPDSQLILWSQKDSTVQHYCSHIGGHTHVSVDLNFPCVTPVSIQQDNQVVLPQLKSMTWIVENKTAVPANRIAVINLKLQDNTKSPSGEMEIKLHLAKDTLEAMLRTLTYISEQLSKSATPALQTAKRQKQ